MDSPRLIDFTPIQESMVKTAMAELDKAGYEVIIFEELIKVDMPVGYRAMTLGNGAAIGEEAFASQDMLNHVLEEECLHLMQKAKGLADEFARGTAFELELDANEYRKFPPPQG